MSAHMYPGAIWTRRYDGRHIRLLHEHPQAWFAEHAVGADGWSPFVIGRHDLLAYYHPRRDEFEDWFNLPSPDPAVSVTGEAT